MQEDLSNKLGEAESLSKALSDELVSVKEMVQKAQEELEAASSELASVVKARDNLKNLESTTHELVDERKTVTTLNRELEALAKQLHADSEARKALEADLDEATKSLDEMNKSALSLSEELEKTHSRNDTLEAEKESLSKALAEQMKITTEAQENTADAQNLITRFQTEKDSFELRSRHLEEELALAKGEILRLRRQISANRTPKPRTITRTRAQAETNETLKEKLVNDHNQKTTGVAAGTLPSAKRVTRRRKGDGRPVDVIFVFGKPEQETDLVHAFLFSHPLSLHFLKLSSATK
jgi:chromosome segregation ATPase